MSTDSPEAKPLSDKAQQILNGAMQEFLAHGYAGTSMDRVAATAGVSKATVYSHFGDKEGLFAALVQRLAQKKFPTIFTPSDRLPTHDLREVLQNMANNMLDNLIEDTDYQNFIRLMIAESGRFPELAQTFARHLAKPGIETLTCHLSSFKELNLPDPEATARIWIGALVHYMLVQEMLHGKDIMPMERDRLVDAMLHLLSTKKNGIAEKE
ncbi:TetR/AcrR family transcriptional regulator [Roseofilum reptotaenium CS-1145]|uniref:TetR family transcriptional regulator n=1 Tax=Roseofilum reptotaenium AO1-A TaxID=1925591 RepID=A0A1L9QQY2_9CYAN|nr:TetR/AcrR family transcriptional regulator [Roseofilum reptotaenium]MDB9519670.1 TetR/AcrR family transcriptional regulator [Roseofilum reptotaenium CS-1145]OJJ24997.1 TetR family transcriptional regulator [Roseofilum reptotaenium AO1-A]